MKNILTIATAVMLMTVVGWQNAFSQDFCQYVDPFIGTDFTGHTYPAATTPFGMVQAGPDNGTRGWQFCSGYHSSAKYILGFSHTHLSGTGAADMGDILLMPVMGKVNLAAGGDTVAYRSAYSHNTEEAHPGYYKVLLETPKVLAEMTATPRCAFHRYSYLLDGKAGVVIDLEHGIGDRVSESYIRLVDSHTVVGMRRSKGFVSDHRYYFCARFSKPLTVAASFEDGREAKEQYISGVATKMLLQADATGNEPLLIKVGLSTATEKGAIRNLDSELPGWDFDAVRAQTSKTWNDMLGRIEVDAMTGGERTSLYTALYHSLLMPNLVTDVDGSYHGWDLLLHRSTTGDLYTNFSLWDTYRAQHPFLALMYPEENSRFVCSMLERHKQVGLLPTNEYGMCETWCMIGNHAVPVIVDAFLKGDKSFDPSLAYDAVRHALTAEHRKSDWTNYDRYGYFPFDKSGTETVSRTMEASYDDWCAAQMAKALGRQADYDFFMKRAGNYKNVYDPRVMLVRGRDSQGNWRTPFNPFALTSESAGGDFTEGNAWQWTWHVQHDADALISLFGSKEKFVQKLDTLFHTHIDELPGAEVLPDATGLIGIYSQGNEPSHHVAYLYTLAGRSDRAAEIVREVFDRFYQPRRDGLCGNDDCGQMSAWYLFSAMGFYPVNPISGEYVFGAPQIKHVRLHLPSQKTLDVYADGISPSRKYVKSVKLNGKEVPLKTLRYEDIKNGAVVRFQMSAKAR